MNDRIDTPFSGRTPPGKAECDTAPRKPWVAPYGIAGTMENAENNIGAGSDGGPPATSNS
jgi:hypothetical protein